ncbi:MAG: copper chaperone PCu(A)C [Rhodomicrobiaceae bacterium]
MQKFPYFRTLGVTMATAMLLAAGTASAHEYKAGDLVIDHPWVRATPPSAPTAGGYAKITNHGTEPDRLTGGSAKGVKRVEVHEITVENNVMKMRTVDGGLEIGPGETVELKPGGYHLMMIGPKDQLTEGSEIEGTLVFEKAGTVDVSFKVEPLGKAMGEEAAAEHDHGGGHKSH